MNYDIKIQTDSTEVSRLEFDQLARLAKSTKDIATKALMLNLYGYSDIKPNKETKKALELFLEEIKNTNNEELTLIVDCFNFSETIEELQLDIFSSKEELLKLTPMALVIQAFHSALGSKDYFSVDKPLLKALLNFKKNLSSKNQRIFLSNRGTIAEIELTQASFEEIEILEQGIPAAQTVVINGLLDEMKVSKGKLGLLVDNELINLLVTKNKDIQNLREFMGNEITIKGIAHYNAKGKIRFVEVKEFNKPEKGDAYFSQIPLAENVQQQLFNVSKGKVKSNQLSALQQIQGLLKDEMNDQQFEEMLKDVRR